MTEARAAPELYSFISYRPERFGGYLFNPYLQRELSLDHFELAVVERCDGQTALAALSVELARAFRTDRANAERRLQAALDKLGRAYALKWRSDPPPPTALPAQDEGECASPWPGPAAPADGCLSAPLSIIWEVTHACNLGCLHCLSSSGSRAQGELTTAEALDLIDELARLRVFSATLGGGEPLVRPDLFALLAYMTERNLCARLSTNGYAVTEDTLHRLADLNVFAVQVSVDGLRETHDALRNRPGSFERAINALRLFTDAGYHTFMTVTASAMNLEQVPALLDLAVELGVSTFKVSPYVPLGRALDNAPRLRLSPTDVRSLAVALRQKARALVGELDLQIEGLFPWLLDPEPEGPCPAFAPGPGCSAGVSQVVVSYEGNVYPCPYMRETSAGNLRQRSLGEIWRDDAAFAPLRTFDRAQLQGRCPTCAYRGVPCNGGCRGAALAATGDLYAQDPHCWAGE